MIRPVARLRFICGGMNKLPSHKRAQILYLLVEGNSMRATARIADVAFNSVDKLYMEHIVLQKETLPEDVQKIWDMFVQDTYARSPLVREHLRRFRDWYQPSLLKIIENVQPRPPTPRRWEVGDFLSPLFYACLARAP
jgi:hypothetical protein